jgi:secreted trypsin-like serine protease
VAVTVLSQEDCVKKYTKDQITKYMLCAASPGADACYGDSGGPFIMKVLSNVVFASRSPTEFVDIRM